jgi:meiotically up-regulated gene 157 (Mug157) protein
MSNVRSPHHSVIRCLLRPAQFLQGYVRPQKRDAILPLIQCEHTAAIKQIFRVMEEQSQATFDEDFKLISYYSWTGGNGALLPKVNNDGNGEPKAHTGMIGTHHRPSDDLSAFGESPHRKPFAGHD